MDSLENQYDPVHQAARSTSATDIMNDSKSTLQRKHSLSKGIEEVDTCRICRGEGTKEEPLFYPCKCSGSIKFVHQECLMEWLSHSQKKHCELCKTPFRFTKLYSPNMPQSIPTIVFLRKASVHIFQALVTWFRGLLVASVWLFWLPWSMRFVWWGLFWIGDGGWSQDMEVIRRNLENPVNISSVDQLLSATSNTSTFSMSGATPVQETVWTRLQALVMIIQINVTSLFSRSFLSSFSFSVVFNVKNASTLETSRNGSGRFSQFKNQDTLLSGMDFFRHLTPSSVVNKFITDVLEGQIITLAVVVAFILIFLIREWVVQQQPIINLGAGDDRDANGNEAENIPAQAGAAAEPAERLALDEDVLRNEVNESSDNTESSIDTDPQAEIDALLQRLEEANSNLKSTNNGSPVANMEAQTDSRDYVSTLSDMKDAVNGIMHLDRDLTAAVDLYKSLTHLKTILPSLTNSELIEVRETLEPVSDFLDSSLNSSSAESSVGSAVGDSSNANIIFPVKAGESSGTNRRRPSMPSKSSSSRAAEIQRDLEESASIYAEDATISSTRYDRYNNEQEQSSGQSSESWQDLDSGLGGTISSTNAGSLEDVSSIENSRRVGRMEEIIMTPSESDSSGSAQFPEELDRSDGGDQEGERNDHTRHSSISSASMASETLNAARTDRANAELPSPNRTMPEGADQQNQPFVERLLDWAWGEVDLDENAQQNQDENEERVVQNIDEEAPFVPIANFNRDQRNNQDANNAPVQDPEVAAEAARARLNLNDADGGDDAEDLEGIMELIGMQGPLTGLFQNSVFCAVLISATVTTTVWFPYLWGKLVLVFLGNPIHLLINFPLRLISGLTNFIIDCCIFAASSVSYYGMVPFLLFTPLRFVSRAVQLSRYLGKMADVSFLRMIRTIIIATTTLDNGSFLGSISAHGALSTIRHGAYAAVLQAWTLLDNVYQYVVNVDFRTLVSSGTWHSLWFAFQQIFTLATEIHHYLIAAVPTLSRARVMNLTIEEVSSDAKAVLINWSTSDRIIAILLGYIFFAVAGALYLHQGPTLTSSAHGRRIEKIITDMLQQAGGVMKVILIISIEMIVFPLYCGLLLDVAMLPLFQNATFFSRMDFTVNSPWTSAFVHWFTGTCYMFHFALFVSMCRKILRSGVLYFIRDPDDPTFHPVRDVLERNISSQLKKIGFSALVYGALVILCMGSVVWTAAHFWDDVFPIRWSPITSIVEFPVDLLLYNILAPVVVHVLKPSKGLHAVYEQWFRICARALRLSHFLFDDDRVEERGRIDSAGRLESGKFVRAPASDAVRIPKGGTVFLEVDGNNERVDQAPDSDSGSHGKTNTHFTKVFIPPWFAFRIYLFVMCLWALTAAVGLCFSVVPLVCGRMILSRFLPDTIQASDIYAYSLGITTLGGILYGGLEHKRIVKYVRTTINIDSSMVVSAWRSLVKLATRIARLFYTYGALTIFFPSLLALVLEFYLIMPLHAYTNNDNSPRYDGTFKDITAINVSPVVQTSYIPQHTIHVLQDWTLGLLYLRILLRMLLWDGNTRPGRALRAVVARGWLEPNARLATRAFILPGTILTVLALLVPAPFGWLALQFVPAGQPDVQDKLRVQIMRFAYPAVAGTVLLGYLAVLLAQAASRWRMRIRDEVYLIGERLHNFTPPRASSLANRR